MATLKDVAKRAGVSIPVVSAYLNNGDHARMSTDTRRRVAAAVDETGYVPHRDARSRRRLRTPIIAVMTPGLDNPILADLLRGIYDATARVDWAVMLGDSARMATDNQRYRHLLTSDTVHGILLKRSPGLDEGTLSGVTKRTSPIVFLDHEADTGYHWLALDDAAGIRAATDHLVALGHEQVDFLGGRDVDLGTESTRLRYQGYVAALAAHGLAPRPPVTCGQAPEQGYEAFSTMLAPRISQRRKDAPTALVVNDVSTAAGVLAAAVDAGISIPRDLSVIAYHDSTSARMLRPALSTVKMPMYELGHRGVKMLGQLINGRTAPSGTLDDIKPEVVPRGSTAPPAPVPGTPR